MVLVDQFGLQMVAAMVACVMLGFVAPGRERGIGIQGAWPHARPGLARRHDDMSAMVASGSERGRVHDYRGGYSTHEDQMG